MPAYKKNKATITSLLEANYGLDKSAIVVLIRELHKEKLSFRCDNNMLYVLDSNNNQIELDKNESIINKINILKSFANTTSPDNLTLYYLNERINMLEGKINDLEKDNEDLHEKLSKNYD